MNINNKYRKKNKYLNEENSSDNTIFSTNSARKDIEKLINIQDIHGTEAYYSNRYGWTLRKIIS